MREEDEQAARWLLGNARPVSVEMDDPAYWHVAEARLRRAGAPAVVRDAIELARDERIAKRRIYLIAASASFIASTFGPAALGMTGHAHWLLGALGFVFGYLYAYSRYRAAALLLDEIKSQLCPVDSSRLD